MSKPRTDRAFWESLKYNNMVYQRYYNRFMELAINSFEWRGLPDSIDERFLELILFADGMAVFFRDDVLAGVMGENESLFALQCMAGGMLDIYRVPTQRRAYATNGYNYACNNTNSVIVYNNYLRTNCMYEAELYAQSLYEIERIITVNIKAQRTPVMVACDESQKLAIQELLKKYEGNEPFIFGYKNIDLNAIKALNTAAPFVADKLQIIKRQIWNEAMTYLGIENANTEKKERLITDEVSSNMGSVEAHRFLRLNARRQAAKKINKMFGTNITVEYREQTPQMPDDTTPTETGGNDDE